MYFAFNQSINQSINQSVNQNQLYYYFAAESGAEYNDDYVCLSARISRKPHGRTSPILLRTLPMALAWSSPDALQ